MRPRLFCAVTVTGLLVVVCRPDLSAVTQTDLKADADSKTEGRLPMAQLDSGGRANALNNLLFAKRTSQHDQLVGLRGTRGLVLDGELEQRTCMLGEPLIVTRTIVNITDVPVTLPYEHRYLYDLFDIRGFEEQRMRKLRWMSWCVVGPWVRTIGPGERLVGTFNLSSLYIIDEPGEYRITTRLHSDGSYADRDPETGGVVLEPAWKGELEYSYGTVRVVKPRRKEDIAALGVLTRYAHRPPEIDYPGYDYTYAHMFDDREKLRNVVESYPSSRYAAYARFFLAVRQLLECEREPRAEAKRQGAMQAVSLLEAIDRPQFGRIFQETVLFHLFYAHQAAGSLASTVERIAEEFRHQFPESQYLYWVEQPDELKAFRAAG